MKYICRLPIAVPVVLWFSTLTALAQMPQPFSADFSAVSKNRTPITGKLFLSAPNMRMDISTGGMAASMIVNGNTKTRYMVMHAQRLYLEMKEGQASPMAESLPHIESWVDAKNPCAISADSTCKDLGPDTVNGRLCEKWQITPKNGSVTTAWVDPKLHFPIKTQTADGGSFELSNIKEGSQPASLFDPPSDYQKMDLGGKRGGGSPRNSCGFPIFDCGLESIRAAA